MGTTAVNLSYHGSGPVRTVDLGNGAQVVPQAKLARMTWRTHEWISRAEEEDIPIDVICSPVPVRRTEMIQAAIERGAGIDVGKKWLAVCIMVGPWRQNRAPKPGGSGPTWRIWNSYAIGSGKRGSRTRSWKAPVRIEAGV